MKQRILIGDLHAHVGKTVTVAGFVDVRRDHGKLIFLDLRDRSGFVQAVALPSFPDAVEVTKTLRAEYVVKVEAKVNARPERMVNKEQKNGDIELELLRVEVLARATELPFALDAELNIDTLFDYRPITLRRKRERAIFTVQALLSRGFRDFLDGEGFTEFQAPKIVGDDAEGGADVFRFEYFDTTASLATSPQLYKQILVGAFERVYSVGSMFRAERHATSRHLNEIAMLDLEMGFIEDHRDVMDLMERMMRALRTRLENDAMGSFNHLGASLPSLPEGAFPTMKLREAQALIKRETGVDKTDAPDLDPEDERWLCEYSAHTFGSDFVFVTHYPTKKRPFYTMDDPDDPGFTKSFDLLFRGVEILSGSQRVHNYDTLVEKIRAKGLDPEKFAFYLMAFKHGLPPHGGIGMGLERLTQKMLGLDNVKEASLFPRDMHRIDVRLSGDE